MKKVKNFVAHGVKLQTGIQIASFLELALQRHRRSGKYITVQPMNKPRRKNRSHSGKVLRSGAKAKVVKRQHNLSLNIDLGLPNGKSHGQGH
jgi:hypothetical protein